MSTSTSTPDPVTPVAPSSAFEAFAAAQHTPESFGRALIAQAIKGMADASGTEAAGGRTAPATITVRPVGDRTLESAPICVDVCVGAFGAEVCIHVVIPESIVELF